MRPCTAKHKHQQRCICCETKLQQPLFCHACQKIQQLKEGADYYQIFAHPIQYEISQQHIDTLYDELMLALHPDYHTQGSPLDQILSMEHTTLLNDAKETLSDPFKRGKYLLNLFCPLESFLDVNPPQSFILEMFDLQEKIDEIEHGGGSYQQTIQAVEQQMQNINQELVISFEQLCNNREDKLIIATIKENLGKYKFLLNLKTRLLNIN